MAETGDALTLPDGTSFSIIESAAESAGERIEFEVTMNPDAQGPPKDFHPRQHESWRVLEGELSVFVEDAWQTLGEGSELSIPHGTVHTLRNRSAEVVPFRRTRAGTGLPGIHRGPRPRGIGRDDDGPDDSFDADPWRHGPARAPHNPAKRKPGAASRRDSPVVDRPSAGLPARVTAQPGAVSRDFVSP
jgi:quercetin dioxygenase-like cupin family protein